MSRKFALVIGNSEYQDATLARLTAPAADVSDLAEVLRAAAIGGFDSVATLVNDFSANVRLEIESFFADKLPEDLLVLYFSGHGVRDDQGHLYLAVKDTRANRLRATGVPAAFVTGEMDRSRSRRQVLILDCCHSGAFEQGSKGVVGQSVGTGPAFEGHGYGRAVLTATDATQFAWEGERIVGEAENSVFTRCLIEGLRTGAADLDGDGQIALDELYQFVFDQVVRTTPKQRPGKWTYKQQGDLILARNPNPPQLRRVELPAELRQALESPFSGVREGAVRELARLLTGSQPALAQAAREALQTLAEDDSRRVSEAARAALAGFRSAEPVEPADADRLRLQAEREVEQRRAAETAAQQQAEQRARQQADDERTARERAAADRAEVAAARQDAEQRARVEAEQRAYEAASQMTAPQTITPRAPQPITSDEAPQWLRQIVSYFEKSWIAFIAFAFGWLVGKRQAEQPGDREAGTPAQAVAPRQATQPATGDMSTRQPANTGETPPVSQMARAGLPLVMLAAGWGLALFASNLVAGIFPGNDGEYASGWAGWLVAGLIGGAATWLALRAAMPSERRVHPALIIGLWAAATLLGPEFYVNGRSNGGGIDETFAFSLALVGALGGVTTGVALWGAGRNAGGQLVFLVGVGWAIAWAGAAWLGLFLVNLFGDDPGHGIKELFTSLLGSKDVATMLVPWVGSVLKGLTGALAGLAGGGVMLWQLQPTPKPQSR